MQTGRIIGVLLALLGAPAALALPVNEWAYRQELTVPEPGLVKLELPPATLDAARADLADVRLLEPQGREVPLLLERPQAPQPLRRAARALTITLEEQRTVVLVETGLDGWVEGVTLRTAGAPFVKAVRVDGSEDQVAWTTLVTQHPIYGVAERGGQMTLPAGKWRWLRLTMDDRRAEAVPVVGVDVQGREEDPAVPVPVDLVLRARDETPGETRLTLALPARNLPVAALALTTREPLFRRAVRVVQAQFSEQGIVESECARGSVSRAADGGENLRVPVERGLPEREVVLVIDNGDSPPLPVERVQAWVRPVRLVFQAAQAGAYRLLVGQPRASAPRYDLAAFADELEKLKATALPVGPLTPQPEYAPAEPLPAVPTTGAPLAVAAWAYRKPVWPVAAGVQQLELDAAVLAQADAGLADLRLINAGTQVPYVVQRTSLTRAVPVAVKLVPDAKRPSVSRWQLTLPQAHLPVTRLTTTIGGALFQRDMQLYALEEDRRGNVERRWLAQATWTQTPERRAKTFSLTLSGTPETDTLWLETDNGDNPALVLDQVELHYPVTRLLFKTAAAQPLALYYGNPEVSAPRYDLSLVGGQLLSAEKTAPQLGAEETLREPARGARVLTAHAGWLFWGGLAVAVLVLLVVVAKLLPKPPAAQP